MHVIFWKLFPEDSPKLDQVIRLADRESELCAYIITIPVLLMKVLSLKHYCSRTLDKRKKLSFALTYSITIQFAVLFTELNLYNLVCISSIRPPWYLLLLTIINTLTLEWKYKSHVSGNMNVTKLEAGKACVFHR